MERRGARVWSSQLLIDEERYLVRRTRVPTRRAHLCARGEVPCTWRGTAVINKLDDLGGSGPGGRRTRNMCDIRQFAAAAARQTDKAAPSVEYLPRYCSKDRTVRGGHPDGPASSAPSSPADSLGIREFRYTESCWWSCQLIPGNLLGGHRGAVLWSTTPPPAPSLLQTDTMPSTTILDTTVAAAAWVRQGRELLLAAAATRESSGVRPGLMHRELGMSVPESPPC